MWHRLRKQPCHFKDIEKSIYSRFGIDARNQRVISQIFESPVIAINASFNPRENGKIIKSVARGKIQGEEPTRELDSIQQDIRYNNSQRYLVRRKKSSEQTDHKTEHRAERRKTRRSEKEKQNEAGKETPENFLRRLTDFALRRFSPCPVNRKAGYSFRGQPRGKKERGRFVDVSSSLYGTTSLHPR